MVPFTCIQSPTLGWQSLANTYHHNNDVDTCWFEINIEFRCDAHHFLSHDLINVMNAYVGSMLSAKNIDASIV